MNFFLLFTLLQTVFIDFSTSQRSTTSRRTQEVKSANNNIVTHMNSWTPPSTPRTSRRPTVTIRVVLKTAPTPTAREIVLRSGANDDFSSPLSSIGGTVNLQFDRVGNLVVVRQCDNSIIWTQTVRSKRSLPDANLPIQTFMATGITSPDEPDTPEAKPEQSEDGSSEDSVISKRLVMTESGNLVVSGSNGEKFWESDTDGNEGADLRLQDNGFLCVFYRGRCIWSNKNKNGFNVTCNVASSRRPTRSPITKPTRRRSDLDDEQIILASGEKLAFGEDASSRNLSIGLNITKGDDGRPLLQVFRRCDKEVLWSAKLWGKGEEYSGPGEMIMRKDGDLVLYNTWHHQQIWASHTHEEDAVLKLYNNGLLCVYKDGRCVWSTERVFTNVNCS